MRHYFIVNPAAGRKDSTQMICDILNNSSIQTDAEVLITQKPRDAVRIVKDICLKNPNPKRFWACGGDGTLGEVLTGMIGQSNCTLSCVPCGSGNDYVKYYGGVSSFLSLENQLNAVSTPVDVMRVGERYSINMINFGLDSVAAVSMQRIKRYPIIGGKNAYYTGTAIAFFTAMTNHCKVYADGKLMNPKGTLLLCTVACGQYIGGQFLAAPKSINDDGLLDVCLVKPVGRLKAAPLISVYKAGEHLDSDRLKDLVVYQRAKEVRLETGKKWQITLDGDQLEIDGSATIEVVPKAVNFMVPFGAKKPQ